MNNSSMQLGACS